MMVIHHVLEQMVTNNMIPNDSSGQRNELLLCVIL